MMTYSAPPTYPKRSRRRLKTRYVRRYPTAMTASAARVVCIHHATCASAAELDGDAEHGSTSDTTYTLVFASLDSQTPARTLDAIATPPRHGDHHGKTQLAGRPSRSRTAGHLQRGNSDSQGVAEDDQGCVPSGTAKCLRRTSGTDRRTGGAAGSSLQASGRSSQGKEV